MFVVRGSRALMRSVCDVPYSFITYLITPKKSVRMCVGLYQGDDDDDDEEHNVASKSQVRV